MTIAIVDDGGHLLWLQRLDGAPPFPRTLHQPRRTAALGRRESKVYEDVINGGRTSFLSAPAVAGMLEGGVPILKDGQCLRGGGQWREVFRRRADCPCGHCRHRPVTFVAPAVMRVTTKPATQCQSLPAGGLIQ